MAKTNILKFIFIGLLFLSLIFCLISLFTPAWRIYQFNQGQIRFGLVTYDCYDNSPGEFVEERNEKVVVSSVKNNASNITVADKTIASVRRNICHQFSTIQRGNYEKATTILIVSAIILLIIAFLNACIIQKLIPKLFWISPILTLIAAILLIISILIYTINADKYFLPLFPASKTTVIIPGNNNQNDLLVAQGNYIPYNFGYSFWFIFAAVITSKIAAIFGFAASKNFGEENSSRLLVQSYITSATK